MTPELVSPDDVCMDILSSVRRSNLHFMIQESPFSLYLTLRKKFTNKKSFNLPQATESCSSKSSEYDSTAEATKALFDKNETELSNSLDIIKQLEDKLERCEADLIQESNKFKISKEQLMDENKLLKDSIKKNKVEEEGLKKNLSEAKKVVKSTEKENYNLQKRVDNFLETTKNFKENIKELKKEKTTAEKSVKVTEKKRMADKEKFEEKIRKLESMISEQPIISYNTSPTTTEANTSLENNNNISKKRSTTSLSSSSTTSQTSLTVIQNSTLMSSKSTPSQVSLSRSENSTINLQTSFSSSLRPPSKCSLVPPLTENTAPLCLHSPQCLLRHPDPPTPPAPIQQISPKPKPPTNIRMFPVELLTYKQYWDLNLSHECDECEPGMLFYNYVEKVEYQDPCSSGDVIKAYLYTCPNHPKATVVVEKVFDEKPNEKSYECDTCRQPFSSLENLEFHKKRNHVKRN